MVKGGRRAAEVVYGRACSGAFRRRLWIWQRDFRVEPVHPPRGAASAIPFLRSRHIVRIQNQGLTALLQFFLGFG